MGLYEEAWGQFFYFCRFAAKEPFLQAIARHEHYLATKMNLQSQMKVLNIGCGVGGSVQEITRFADIHLSFAKGDFMQLPFAVHSFDAVYAIEATVYALNLEGVYSEIFRVLKPASIFGVYEGLINVKYNASNPRHREIRLGIEQGNGISNVLKVEETHKAIKTAGFELQHAEGLSIRPDLIPRYFPIAGDFKYMGSLRDIYTVLRMTRTARAMVQNLLYVMEIVRLAPVGSARTAASLAKGADSFIAWTREGLFTPMYFDDREKV